MNFRKAFLTVLSFVFIISSSTSLAMAQTPGDAINNFADDFRRYFIDLAQRAVCGVGGIAGSPNILPSCGCSSSSEVNTALGCISTDAEEGGFATSLLTVAVGLGGGIALLLMLYGVFIITTSSGMPEKLKEGQEIITSAISGLVFILISIFLMNFIGVKILAIPGL